ncbi:hypothetical protein [Ornithobacterium rhinotracheale]
MKKIEKECYCHTCKKWFHFMGIAKHRAAHKNKGESCKITFTNGDTYFFNYKKTKLNDNSN